MKVLRVSNTGGNQRVQLGGAERGIVQQTAGLIELGFDFVCVIPESELVERLEAVGATVIVDGPAKYVDLAYARRLRRYIEQSDADLIHLHLLSSSVHGRVAARAARTKAPLVVSLHNDMWEILAAAPSPRDTVHASLNASIERLSELAYGSTHVAVGQTEYDNLWRRFRYARRALVPNELPPNWTIPTPDERCAARAALGLDADAFVCGTFMRLEASKGADVLWETIPYTGASFVVCGDGALQPPDLDGQIVLRETHVRDVRTYMLACDAVVVPSLYESFGRTAVEALALGVPVIHTAVGGLAWVTDGVDWPMSVVAKPNSVPALVDAIEQARQELTSMPGLPELQAATARTVVDRFGYERGIGNWASTYRGLAS